MKTDKPDKSSLNCILGMHEWTLPDAPGVWFPICIHCDINKYEVDGSNNNGIR